jgi:cytochrome c peroxidase
MAKIITSACLALLLCLLAALSPKPDASPTLEAVRAYYHQGLLDMDTQLRKFIAELERSNSSPEEWQAAFANLRNSYKKIEFLLAYLDEDNVRDYLNGPPLPTIDRVVAELVTYEPAGMQIIEEHLYSAESVVLRGEILQLSRDMALKFALIRKAQTNLYFSDRQVLESVRAGIFRVTTMGLVGFDTPGSGWSLQESAISMQSMSDIISLYTPYLQNRKQLTDRIDAAFKGCVQTLGVAADFEKFDRMSCIRLYLEPLYGHILALHLALGIETTYQVNQLSRPLNYLSPSMFEAGAFNDHYYAGTGTLKENPDAIMLGRMLFFDPVLSKNNRRACASCHLPEKAFTDGLPKSLATNLEGTVGRNAPTLINSIFADKYFYDFRSDRLETQAEHVIFNEKEFNTTYYEIIDKLNQSAEYRVLFQKAFGHEPNTAGIARALAVYVRSLASFNSPIDRYLRGESADIEEEVRVGFNLFMGKALCGTCHFAPTYSGLVPPSFTENESEVIGVPLDPGAEPLQIDPDLGRYDNGRARDHAVHLQFSFKTPTIRNAALTAPYMHNGVYPTLASVVDFYNRGGGAGLGLDLPHQTLPFDQLHLSELEQRALVRFMEALTDTAGLTQRPSRLPLFDLNPSWNARKIGGDY